MSLGHLLDINQGKAVMKSILTLLLGCSLFLPAHAAPKVGEVPRDYVGRNMEGEKVTISQFKGRVVLVSFWATWCTYCLKELPILEGLQKRVGQDNLQVIAVNHSEPRKMVKQIAQVFEEDGIELLLTHDKKGRIAKRWGVGGIPHLVMIDRNGVIAHIEVGYGESSQEAIIQKVITLLAKPKLPTKEEVAS